MKSVKNDKRLKYSIDLFVRGRQHIRLGILSVIGVFYATVAAPNGYQESSPWQFNTASETSARAQVADMIERQAAGYYNSFENSYVTNIGTQINCTVTSSAVGNQATNTQSGNAPSLGNSSTVLADAQGNDANNDSSDGTGSTHSEQTNTGSVTGQVDNVNSSTSGSNTTGNSENALGNDQNNSGNQSASTDNSIGCEMAGAALNSTINSSTSGVLN